MFSYICQLQFSLQTNQLFKKFTDICIIILGIRYVIHVNVVIDKLIFKKKSLYLNYIDYTIFERESGC